MYSSSDNYISSQSCGTYIQPRMRTPILPKYMKTHTFRRLHRLYNVIQRGTSEILLTERFVHCFRCRQDMVIFLHLHDWLNSELVIFRDQHFILVAQGGKEGRSETARISNPTARDRHPFAPPLLLLPQLKVQ
eukprot:GHVU01063829.1.p1 GENE.GHVU01063829.1~~GHVU01063829.1.p1  ORF type:complete len:133 (+),score=5.62 GHVU01063829.1:155-553(+)